MRLGSEQRGERPPERPSMGEPSYISVVASSLPPKFPEKPQPKAAQSIFIHPEYVVRRDDPIRLSALEPPRCAGSTQSMPLLKTDWAALASQPQALISHYS